MTYQIRRYCGDDLSSISRRCATLSGEDSRPDVDRNLELAQIRMQSNVDRLNVVGLLREDELVGMSPISRGPTNQHSWRLRLPGRDFKLVRFRLNQGHFYGDHLLAPGDMDAQRALLRGVIEACGDCHILGFPTVDCGSALYQLLTRERWRPFVVSWQPREPWTRWMVRLSGSYEDYFQTQFSRRRRHELRRERRRFEEGCPEGLRLGVVTQPDDVEAYLEKVRRIVSVSWQGRRFTSWPHPTKTLVLLRELAAQSMFRGYLLSNGDEPIAFTCGCLVDGVYAPDRTAYDPKWSDYSPGKHLWLSVLEDLFRHGGMNWLDFGRCDLWYKQFLSNHQHEEAAIFLIQGKLLPMAALAPSIVTRAGLRLFSNMLRPFNLQTAFRRFLYRVSRGPVGQ